MAQALPTPGDCCDICDDCGIEVIIIPPSGGGGGGGTTTACPTVTSLAAVRALTAAQALACGTINVNGTMVGGDGFLGSFDWDVLDGIHPDDGALYLEASDHPVLGRWVRRI